VRANYPVDSSRIYLTGRSGGGFMTILMAARHPEVWAAARAWSSIADLAEWYNENTTGPTRAQLDGCFGGGPATSESLGGRYREQSPLTYLRPNLGVPLDIGHGNQDTQVAVRHSLRAFASLAPTAMSESEIERFVTSGFQNAAAKSITDPLIAVPILLRRAAGDVRLTIYEGEHGFYPKAAIEWMSAHQRR
jgi:poly(3-hydroxybutyrate) depolymerase